MDSARKIKKAVARQKSYFNCGQTRKIEFRLKMLDRLFKAIKEYEPKILAALHADLRKTEFESVATEISIVLEDIAYARKHLKKWASPHRAGVAMLNFPASGKIYAEPYGSVLIFSTWNYPFQMLLSPLVGAMAAGNCAVLKPSEQAPATAELLLEMVGATFDPEYIVAFPGGIDSVHVLLNEKFDYIFFTGGTRQGREVMKAAAEHLTPVTLELGGKSPCIVDADANLNLTAKRIVWGKFLNAGQTCVAPDYLFVHKSIKKELLEKIEHYIGNFYGKNPQESPDYPRIINDKHFDRLADLMHDGKIVCGGQKDRKDNYIAPTVIDHIEPDDTIMQEEIFGPLLPVVTFEKIIEVIEFIIAKPKPLAMYYFSRQQKNLEALLSRTSAGGVCVNETVTHLINPSMPFGGVGNSGMGAYHGKYSFDTFTHYKPVMIKGGWLDVPLRYPPFKNKIGILRWFTR
ncbi:MAG: aldehyde dehydrogenase [Victivallaceae bacterium]